MEKPKSRQILITINYPNDLGCWIWIIPFLGLAFWAISNNKILWIFVSIFMLYFISEHVYSSNKQNKNFNKWIEENDNIIILFYPTNKITQDFIHKKIGSRIDSRINQMFYDKSKIVGDIKNVYFIKMGLSQLNWLKPNQARLIQLSGKNLVELINLSELKEIEKMDQKRIDKIISVINKYVC